MAIEKSDAKARSTAKAIRMTILVAILAISTAVGLLHQFSDVKPVSVDALCPFGGIESAWSVIASGTLLAKVAWSSFLLLGATLLTAVFFRRSFCGNICPLGTLQELFAWVGKKVLGRHYSVPGTVDRWARYLKYLVLAVFVILSAALGTLVIRPYDPWATYHHLLSPELLEEFLVGFLVLLLTIVGSFFYNRFFCKYLCPMGAALTPFAKVGLFKIKRNASTCINCSACDKACPVNLPVSKLDTVKDPECLDCDLCVNACPVKDTLVIQGPGGKRISPTFRNLATLAIFLLVVGLTTFTGTFRWTMPPLTKGHTDEGKPTIDFEAIKGSDTWQSVIDASGIPKQAFLERFQLTEADLSQPIKTKAHAPGSTYDTEAVREWVKEKLH